MSLTHEAAVEHPGSYQQEGQLEEDEVVMIPGTWTTTEVFHSRKMYLYFFDDIQCLLCIKVA